MTELPPIGSQHIPELEIDWQTEREGGGERDRQLESCKELVINRFVQIQNGRKVENHWSTTLVVTATLGLVCLSATVKRLKTLP